MKFKRIIASVLVLISLILTSCANNKSEPVEDISHDYKIAMITDSGDITDKSFNETSYEACKEFCNEYQLDFQYYKPAGDTTEAKSASIKQAIEEGFNVIVTPGYLFAQSIIQIAPENPDVKFIAVDITEEGYIEAVSKEKNVEFNDLRLNEIIDLNNVYTVNFKEEISGFLAGYATVKMGYTNIGFIGGIEVPAVQRYGYGFIQGADKAAKENNITISCKYSYAGTFTPDHDKIYNAAKSMYGRGTEVIFACGGLIYEDIAQAASESNCKIIGVDVDQAKIIDAVYGEGITITSAMKGIKASIISSLNDLIVNNEWDEKCSGKIVSLGLVSNNPDLNYCQLGSDTQFNDQFTKNDYIDLVSKIHSGEIKISNAIDKTPDISNIKIEYTGVIIKE